MYVTQTFLSFHKFSYTMFAAVFVIDKGNLLDLSFTLFDSPRVDPPFSSLLLEVQKIDYHFFLNFNLLNFSDVFDVLEIPAVLFIICSRKLQDNSIPYSFSICLFFTDVFFRPESSLQFFYSLSEFIKIYFLTFLFTFYCAIRFK